MPSGKGGKKLTKAEKEKKKREEEERKRIEEEEEKVRQEEEAKIRRKQEKIEAEERKKQEKEELKIRSVELKDLRGILDSFKQQSAAFHDERRLKARWNRYLLCDGSPDPTIQTEINAYINMWREDEKRVLIDDVFQDSLKCLRLISELSEYIEDSVTLDTKTKDMYQNTIHSLQKLLQEKLNRSTYELLRRAIYMVDPETQNLEKFWNNESCTLCLWGNLCKNPRIKSYDFKQIGISFEIPKALTKVGCAYRFLFTYFDHFSSMSRSHDAILIPVIEPEVEEPVVEETVEEVVEEAEKEPEPDPEKEKADDLFKMEDLMAELHKLDDGEDKEEVPEPEVEEVIETPVEDLRSSPIPKVFEDFDGEEDAIDLRAFQIVGPIMHFNLLQMPTQPVQKNGWTIIQHCTPPDIQAYDYKPEIPKPEEPAAETNEQEGSVSMLSSITSTKQADVKKPVEIENPPICVTYQLPKNVYYAEQPQVAVWDNSTKEWRTNGVEVTNFDEKEHSLTFKTCIFGTFAFLQDFHINMPFQSWELRPQGTKTCQLTVVASINEVVIQVKEDKVCVVLDADDEEGEEGSTAVVAEGRDALRSLAGKWMSVKEIVESLRAAGINLFPREDSFKYVTIADKSAVAEDMLYVQMAQMCTSMAFSWSRWNLECKDRSKLILQACEHLSADPLNEEEWSVYAFTRQKVQRLKIKEFDETFSEDVDTSLGFHADFFHVFSEMGSEEGKARNQDVDFQFFDTVYELLRATRPMVFS